MSLLTELEILGAGFLQRCRAYGAGEYPEGNYVIQPNRNAVAAPQPSVAETQERLRWVTAYKIYQL